MLVTKQLTVAIDFHSMGKNMEVNGYHQLCNCTTIKEEIFFISSFVFSRRNSYKFGTAWGWVNEIIFIFQWKIPLNSVWLFSVDGMQETCLFTSQHVFMFCLYLFIFMHLFPSLYVACAFIFMLLPPSQTACFQCHISTTAVLLSFWHQWKAVIQK